MPLRSRVTAFIKAGIGRTVGGRLDMIEGMMNRLVDAVARAGDENARRAQTLAAELASLREELARRDAELLARIQHVRDIAAAGFDAIPELRAQLLEARRTEPYNAAFSTPEPLVSVRIATFNRSALLLERAIPSVLRQTYRNLEVVVVGDGCTDDTAEKLAAVPDPRVRFVNLPHQGVYPNEPRRRWMVAGAPAMNEAAQIAKGAWIAPLDDDDEFHPDHVACLLEHARSGRFEAVYGNLEVKPRIGEPYVLRRYPPAFGHFGWQGAIYLAALRFFEYDLRAWVLDEVADWTMCRRMIEAGVRVGWVDRPVTVLYPTGPRVGEAAER
jgi:hypothetical protein